MFLRLDNFGHTINILKDPANYRKALTFISSNSKQNQYGKMSIMQMEEHSFFVFKKINAIEFGRMHYYLWQNPQQNKSMEQTESEQKQEKTIQHKSIYGFPAHKTRKNFKNKDYGLLKLYLWKNQHLLKYHIFMLDLLHNFAIQKLICLQCNLDQQICLIQFIIKIMINQSLTQSRTQYLSSSQRLKPSYKSMMKKVLLQRMKCDSEGSAETNRTIEAEITSKTTSLDQESNLQIFDIPNFETPKNKIMAYSESLTVIDQYCNIQSIAFQKTNKNIDASKVDVKKKFQLSHKAYTEKKNFNEKNHIHIQYINPNKNVRLHSFGPQTQIEQLLPAVSQNLFDKCSSNPSVENISCQQLNKNRRKQTCSIKVEGESILSSLCCFRKQNKQKYENQIQPTSCEHKLKKFVKPLQKSEVQQQINRTTDSYMLKKGFKLTLQNSTLIKK